MMLTQTFDISDMHSDNYPPELTPYLQTLLYFKSCYKHTHTYKGTTDEGNTTITLKVYDYRTEFVYKETLESLVFCDRCNVILTTEESTDAPT